MALACSTSAVDDFTWLLFIGPLPELLQKIFPVVGLFGPLLEQL